MSDQHTPITEEELHAYVDGTLSDERRADVERALEQNPELASRISDYFSLNSMFHERYDRVLNEPVPKRLQPAAPRQLEQRNTRCSARTSEPVCLNRQCDRCPGT